MDSRSLIVLSSLLEHNSTRLHCPFLDHSVNGGEERPVGGNLESIGIAEARSALAWWLESGVDVAVQEDARDWLKPAPVRASAAAPEPLPEPKPILDTFEQFREWLGIATNLPMARQGARRVLPQGA